MGALPCEGLDTCAVEPRPRGTARRGHRATRTGVPPAFAPPTMEMSRMRFVRMRRRTALAAAGVLAIAGAVSVPVAAYAPTACEVVYATNDWSNGFTANVTIKNLGDPLTSWNLGRTFPNSGQRVTQAWSSTVT